MRLTKTIVSCLVLLAVSTLLVLVGAEFVLRALGHRPWQPAKIDVVVEPEGRMYDTHPTIGYVHKAGAFQVTLPTSYSFSVTHSDEGLRATRPQNSNHVENSRDEIWIFGCSLTYGWTLNDEETYPWRLQQNLPDYEVVNFGVNGFGTVHSLVQFREALQKRNKPHLVIVSYASFHDARNTMVRDLRKGLVHTQRHPLVQPFARLADDGGVRYAMSSDRFYELPFMRRSALMHALEKSYNGFESRRCRSHEVSRAIVTEFAELCEQRNIAFVLAGIFRDELTSEMLEFAERNGIETVDISVDLEKRGYRNLPHDAHPSALANKQYAHKLGVFLNGSLLPTPQSTRATSGTH